MKLAPFQGVIVGPNWAKVVSREYPLRVGEKIKRQKPFVAAVAARKAALRRKKETK